MIILDESSRIKNFKAKRTKAILKLSQQAKYKRILTGTPITQNAMDLYPQFQFLDPEILGFQSFVAFRNYFCVMERSYNRRARKEYETIVGFQNLEKLQKLIKPHSVRVMKEQCLDLPEKTYETIPVQMSAEQKRMYKKLKDDLIVTHEDGSITTAMLPITMLLRFSQITGGYINTDDGETISLDNPKIKVLEETLQDLQGSVIIWARFRAEIKAIAKMLKDDCVTYFGDTTSDQRERAIADFQAGRKKYFIGNPQAGGLGITLTKASTAIYYSNSYSLEDRLQSQDRCYRIGQDKKVLYLDLVMENTVDVKVEHALKNKQDLASLVNENNLKDFV
jgi:SNF2 family DNA or RNA helicase